MTIDLYTIKVTRQDVLDSVNDPSRFSEYRRGKIQSTKLFSAKCLSAAAGIAMDEGLRRFGLREREARYIFNDRGKPYIDGHPEIIFNISHSGEYAVAAFLYGTEQVIIYDIGVDIEQIARINKRIVTFMKNDVGFENESINNSMTVTMSKQEAEIQPDSCDGFRKDLCRRWTAREAFIKCLGTGLASIREDYHFEKTATGNLRLCQSIYDGEFTIIEPEAPEGYCITCVVRRQM